MKPIDRLDTLTIYQWRDRALNAEARIALFKDTVKGKDEALTRYIARIRELEGDTLHISAHGHIQLAWGKAYPVPAGTTIPAGKPFMERTETDIHYFPVGLPCPYATSAIKASEVRTITPLPTPNPRQKTFHDITKIISDELEPHMEPWLAEDLAGKIADLLEEQE